MANVFKSAVNFATAVPRATVGLARGATKGSVAEGVKGFQAGSLKGGLDLPLPSPAPDAPGPIALDTTAQTGLKFDASISRRKPRRGGSLLTSRSSGNPFPFITN